MDKAVVDLEEVRRFVESEIESYRYEVPEGALGRPFPVEWVERQLTEMRAALVEPEWREVMTDDTEAQRMAPGFAVREPRRCILVADDRDGFQLYYDPLEGDFTLAQSGGGIPGSRGRPETIGVRGDAVGCFMAR